MQRAGAIERHPDDPALLGEGLQDRLPDPPHRIGDELDSLGLVELVRRADEAKIPLVDQIRKRNPLILILLGNGNHESEIAAPQLVERLGLAGTDALGKRNLFLLVDQRILADLAEVLVERAFVE